VLWLIVIVISVIQIVCLLSDIIDAPIFKAAANDNYTFSGGAHLRDAYCHDISIVADMKLDQRATEFCIVYINGEYWGVYDVREKADDLDYTNHYYDQPEHFVDYLKTWGGTWEEYGDGQNDWDGLVAFITGNDMTDAANYDYVISQYNQTSLIDYFVLNSYVVATDWLNWNTAWWRGEHPDGDAKRWKYVLWDMDATFGHYINYTGVPDTSPEADPCNPEGLGDPGGQGHVPILNALLENEDFFAEYINRYASMSNSHFSCEHMNYFLDSMTAVIGPEMQGQVDRWGGTYAGWEGAVQELRDFIDERCASEIVEGMEDCYDIEAVTLTIIVDGLGTVELQGLSPVTQAMSPWDGIYYAEVPIELEALIDLGLFIGWEVISGGVVIDDPTDPFQTIVLTEDATIVAHFDSNLDPQLIMYDVQPAGAGDVLIDNVPMGPYPNTVLTDGGIHIIEATENPWFEFDHWETINANINPDDTDPEGSFFVVATDTIVAFYNEIPHFNLTVDVEPAGAGTIQMDGTPMASYPWSDVVEGEVDINFLTIPTDEWSIFSHWEINNNVIMPDELSPNMTVNLTDDDVIVAVYNVIPHFGITVVVDPPFGGSVAVDNIITVQDEWTGVVEGSTDMPFLASPSPYWNFVGWKANFHSPQPDEQSRLVDFNFTAYDTIFAYFEPEEFAMYIPNSITPNNDGRNDVFLPIGNAIDVTDYTLMIFNRWGDKVFETTDPNKAWTGNKVGGDYYVEDEIYVYHLSVKSVHDLEEKEFMGHIMVFR
jgi:gliding motility-associated-like protein